MIAVPGSAEADAAEIGPRVASIAGQSCPGVDIRVGYLEGNDLSLADCLMLADADAADHDQFPCVIVPLLLGPSPAIDAALRQIAAQPALQSVVAGHLGPHPLVAEALHARLAEAGLARHARSSGLSISPTAAASSSWPTRTNRRATRAAVVAVLLASRLSVPVRTRVARRSGEHRRRRHPPDRVRLAAPGPGALPHRPGDIAAGAR